MFGAGVAFSQIFVDKNFQEMAHDYIIQSASAEEEYGLAAAAGGVQRGLSSFGGVARQDKVV